MNSTKKGLVIVYDPHNLYQFIWYYCNIGNKLNWDALCLPNDRRGEYMHPYCDATGIFEKVYKYDDSFKSVRASRKIRVFAKMLVYYVIGQRKKYCRNLINQYVRWDAYDQVVILTSVGFVSGACAALSDEKDVVILEDGGSDYLDRKKWIEWKNMKSPYHWQGFILSHMGYCCPGWFYFKPEKNCVKYSSCPDRMNQDNYKEIRQLFDPVGTNQELLDEIVNKTYPQIKDINFNEIEAVFLSIPLSDHVKEVENYKRKLEYYMSDKYHTILLKRHPRDEMEYVFNNTLLVDVENTIPAEALMPYLKNKDVYMCESCSTVMYAKAYDLKCIVLVMEGYYEESILEGVNAKALSEKEVCSYVKEFGGAKCSVVKI